MAGFVAASGFGQLESGMAARYTYWNEFLDNICYEEASWSNWVSSSADEVLRQYQVVKFAIPAEPTPYRKYEKNQKLMINELQTPGEVCAQMSCAEYSSDKLDDMDVFRIPEAMDKFMETTKMKRTALHGETLNARVLARFIAEASRKNQGPQAGEISRSYNLGTSAAPIDLSSADPFTALLANMQAVAIETKCFGTGAGWHAVIPNQLLNKFYGSKLADKFNLGACSELVCNVMNSQEMKGAAGPFGIRWWVNAELSRPAANGAVPVIMFHEDAQIFTSQTVASRVYEHPDFYKTHDTLLISGGKVLKPNRVVVAWVRF
jgi:hypothetical protein